MSWMDIVVVIILALMGFLGHRKGFTVTIMHIAGWVISAIIAIKYYPVVSTYLINNTDIYTTILGFINDKLTTIGQIPLDGTTFNLSDFIKMPGMVNDLVSQLDFSSKDMVSLTVGEATTKILLDLVSIVLIFAAMKALLITITLILDRLANLPVLKQLNQVGGLVLGIIKGLILVWVLLALLVPILGVTENEMLINSLEKSVLTEYLYKHNIIFNIVKSYIN